MKELIGLAVLAVLGVVLWQSREKASTTPRCPSPTELDALLADVLSGKTTGAQAEIVAQSYDRAGCPDAASALRTAVTAKGSTGLGGVVPPSGLLVSDGFINSLETKATPPDVPEPLRSDVIAYLDRLGPGKPGGPFTAKDAYYVQQLMYRWPGSRPWVQAVLDSVAPGFPQHTLDTSADPMVYFPAAVQP